MDSHVVLAFGAKPLLVAALAAFQTINEGKRTVGTDPAERAFYRAFRDFNPLNDLGIR